MYVFAFVLCLSIFITINCQNVKTDLSGGDQKFSDMYGNVVVLEEYCKEKPCITKCCDKDEVLDDLSEGCKALPLEDKYFNLTVYRIFNDKIEKTDKIFNETFYFVKDLNMKSKSMMPLIDYDSYIIDNGSLLLQFHNRFHKLSTFRPNSFCLEYLVFNDPDVIKKPKLILCQLSNGEQYYNAENDDVRSIYSAIGLLVSCFFMMLVLLVYSVLPELRNMGGLVLMANVVTMMIAFLSIVSEALAYHFDTNTEEFCTINNKIKYTSFLSCFFWMTIMAFDIWKTLTFAKFTRKYSTGSLDGRTKYMTFGFYTLFGWGIPCLMGVAVILLDRADLGHMRFVKPNMDVSCFFGDEGSKFYYLYTPMLVLIIINTLFYLLTLYNFYRVVKLMSRYDNKNMINSKRHNTRFWLYMKLSVVMGISWIMEVAFTYLPPSYDWVKYLGDTYNMLVGVAIFFIYVFKKRIFVMLLKRFSHWSFIRKLWLKFDTSGVRTTHINIVNRKTSTVSAATVNEVNYETEI